MPTLIDLTGQKFNRLTVIQRDHTKNSKGQKGTFWLCECECGNEVIVNGSALKNGKTKSCGCLQKEKARINGGFQDLTGLRFGYLTVIKENKEYLKKDKYTYWDCKCDCGNLTTVSSYSLTSGNTSSCGCFRLEQLRKSCGVDLTNQRFGNLIVLEEDKEYKKENNIKNRHIYWKCKCDCGSIISIDGVHLRRGETQSCGCVISRGEKIISEILQDNNILFEKQKTFKNCKFNNGRLAKFDFYINNEFLLEYDGIQHHKRSSWDLSEEDFNKRKEYDEYKNQWCKKNFIPLKRIPYTDINKITLKNILDDTYLVR